MAESHKCQICGKPATVHLTQISGGKIHKFDLCDECAHAKGVTDPDGYSVSEANAGKPVAHKHPAGESIVCGVCGITAKDFKKMGHFGCPSCYEYFGPIITPMLEGMHRDIEHRGRQPARSLARLALRKKITLLESVLSDAVAEERFEEAARLRDELGALKDQLQDQIS